MTEFEILQFINNVKDEQGNNVFAPSGDIGKVETKYGATVEYFRSFYRRVKTKEGDVIERIKIRSANHPVVMSDWENNEETPWENKYNIDIVFSKNVQENANKKCHKFFVIEQFVYNIDDMTPNKLQKIIDSVLKVGENGYKDPLKKAHKYVLQPYYINEPEKKILPPTDGSVHPHQIEVWTQCEKSQSKNKTNESYRKIYKLNMTHIKKLNEMTSSARTSKMLNESELIDTIKKYDIDKLDVIEALVHNEYSLTLDGLLALYQHFYNDDISFFTEFLGYTGDRGNDWLADEYEWWDFVKLYVAYKLLDDISIEEIIQAIIDEEYGNYLHPNCDLFDEFEKYNRDDTRKWVKGFCAEVGIKTPDMDD